LDSPLLLTLGHRFHAIRPGGATISAMHGVLGGSLWVDTTAGHAAGWGLVVLFVYLVDSRLRTLSNVEFAVFLL